jgi:hypothetical protein
MAKEETFNIRFYKESINDDLRVENMPYSYRDKTIKKILALMDGVTKSDCIYAGENVTILVTSDFVKSSLVLID